MPFKGIMTSSLGAQTIEQAHSACGVGLRINLPHYDEDGITHVRCSHDVVREGLKILGDFEYRSGEDDGAGIKCHGLSSAFFNHKIAEGVFLTPSGDPLSDITLSDNAFIIGQFFLSEDPSVAQSIIGSHAEKHGLSILAWRDLHPSLRGDALTERAKAIKPGIWQCILLPMAALTTSLEETALKSAISIASEAQRLDIALDILSFSAETIVYKGLVKASRLGDFFEDLQDARFTAYSTSVHARFATNTLSQWRNAQPCVFFTLHNGELNSAPANATEMRHELYERSFEGIYPKPDLSDSMQFDADVANHMLMKNIPFLEAFIRLMPPRPTEPGDTEAYSDEINAMLRCFQLERTGYNGPAFMVASAFGYSIAKLDESCLRPSHWGIIEDRDGHQALHAASDDYLEPPEGGRLIKKRHLDPGGMIVITPEGAILETKEALAWVCERYHSIDPLYFQHLFEQTTMTLVASDDDMSVPSEERSIPSLNRRLYAAGWDREAEASIRYIAETGMEQIFGMGDDTNPFHSPLDPPHIAYFMHQLFQQVSAPPLDSTNEPDDFSLSTHLGAALMSYTKDTRNKRILLDSPLLQKHTLSLLERQSELPTQILDTSFELPEDILSGTRPPVSVLENAIKRLLEETIAAAARMTQGGVLILSDRHTSPHLAVIPDVIAVAAVRKQLEALHCSRLISIVADSYQITGPHHVAVLLTLGAKAIFPRGAHDKIEQYFGSSPHHHTQFEQGIKKCLLKTMGKVGLNNVNNYICGGFVAALGINLSDDKEALRDKPTLSNLFDRLYSPLKGIRLSHIANGLIQRHINAYHDATDFRLLPPSGTYMPETKGITHGYGPVVIHAFTHWLKTEDIDSTRWRLHHLLAQKGFPDFLSDVSRFTPEHGFLNPQEKDATGFYPIDYLERFKPSAAFKEMIKTLDDFRKKNPTALKDYMSIVMPSAAAAGPLEVQSQQAIRACLFAGSMSQGALTVSNPDTPEKLGAHETLTRGMNAIGAMSASGEGGEAAHDLRDMRTSTRSKQIASGRFGISAVQINAALEIEIKIAQGAKPGEGGQLPGTKVSVRIAAQRGGLPGTPFISPPPHHDIYSIEDLEQLIHDIKSVNPHAKVCVKLVASQGIGTIAIGVAKAGADVINIAGHSGGTGAAQGSSIKHTGLPAEIGLIEVNRALERIDKRHLVQLRVSGGFKTVEDVLIAAILGADLFEFGTTAMLTLGCKMQRTCNQSCQPGVATDGHLFKGEQLNTERYFVQLAAMIQEQLRILHIPSLQALKGRIDLVQWVDPSILALYDLDYLLSHPVLHLPTVPELDDRLSMISRPKEDDLAKDIHRFFEIEPSGTYLSTPILLTTQDRSFGGRLAHHFARYLEHHPDARIIIQTQGIAGQSFGFVLPKGMSICHLGPVQDGCGKSMTGGELILSAPHLSDTYRADENTLSGNALGYGASGGVIHVNGVAGHRAFVLAKGVTAVVEGVGKRAFEFMTSGTGLILGPVGKELCAKASGGIVFVYDPSHTIAPSQSVRIASASESMPYEPVIRGLLQQHMEKTNSQKARDILDAFDPEHFHILIPKAMDAINTLRAVIDVIKTYHLREAPISEGMRIWLEQQTLQVLTSSNTLEEWKILLALLDQKPLFDRMTLRSIQRFIKGLIDKKTIEIEDIALRMLHSESPDTPTAIDSSVSLHPRTSRRLRPVTERLKGGLDELLIDALAYIHRYVTELTAQSKGCSSCGAQSCAGGESVESGCPSGKNINALNSTLQRIGPIHGKKLSTLQWRTLREAFDIQIKKSPFIRYTGAACPAPCQDACTESIPSIGAPVLSRAGKPTGEPVHIKSIELSLDHIGRALGWFHEGKAWSDSEILALFDTHALMEAVYLPAMAGFKAPFQKPDPRHMKPHKKLVIVGSGPAGMQIAFEALRDGIPVSLYEKSDKPGGLLMDGIPHHKFDKRYIDEDFMSLIHMGLELHLNSEVIYDGVFYIKGDASKTPVIEADNPHHHIVLCVGGGQPKPLPTPLLADIPDAMHSQIIQAIDFLKIANDTKAAVPVSSDAAYADIIAQRFGAMNPLGKKIIVIGGGDTAQDVARWLARYFSLDVEQAKGYVGILVRGPKLADHRGILDAYPTPARTYTPENKLRLEEIAHVDGDHYHLVSPQIITPEPDGKFSVTFTESQFKYLDAIDADPELSHLSKVLPRELRPLDSRATTSKTIPHVDLIICALGFQGQDSIPIIVRIKEAGILNVSIAGDAADAKPHIIVGAQASGYETYHNRIRKALGLGETPPAQRISALATHSLFSLPPKVRAPTDAHRLVASMSL